jgi:hypothetical protein
MIGLILLVIIIFIPNGAIGLVQSIREWLGVLFKRFSDHRQMKSDVV